MVQRMSCLKAFFSASIIAIAGLGMVTTSSMSDTLYRSPLYDNSLRGGPSYRGGGKTYYTVPENSLRRNSLYDSQLQDSDGNMYNCNSLGSCTKSSW